VHEPSIDKHHLANARPTTESEMNNCWGSTQLRNCREALIDHALLIGLRWLEFALQLQKLTQFVYACGIQWL
jgi:hypothetical protein